jgi:hypothetical protein
MKLILSESDKAFARKYKMTDYEMFLYKQETLKEEEVLRDWYKIQNIENIILK